MRSLLVAEVDVGNVKLNAVDVGNVRLNEVAEGCKVCLSNTSPWGINKQKCA